MSDLFTPLSEEEIERLDRFLLDRIDENADTAGRDDGVLGMSDLDGLFAAVVSGPEVIRPSAWLPLVWGDFEPVWDSEDDFMEIFSLMMRHMNSISFMLMAHPADFEPIFMERKANGRTFTIVDEWCEGYMRGVAVAAEQWDAGGREMMRLLTPILAFTGATNWKGHEFKEDEVEALQQTIAPSVREIHAFWLARRNKHGPAAGTVCRSGPRVGRNDPCPCGSGKKYKKCCLH